MLTPKEQEVKNIMEEVFVPVLHDILSTANPKEYKAWNGNACRQTALFGAKLLQEYLPEYKWSVWDGIFEDVIQGVPRTYDHAWIFGVNRAEGRRLLVDLSRLYQERLFILSGSNRYPKDHPEYLNLKEVQRRSINIDDMMGTKEHLTDMTGHDLYALIKKHMLDKMNSISAT